MTRLPDDALPGDPIDYCYTCEQDHGPMGWHDGCTDDRDGGQPCARCVDARNERRRELDDEKRRAVAA